MRPSSIARTTIDLAEALGRLKGLGIAQHPLLQRIQGAVLGFHPELIGVWTVWEPDAPDDRDGDPADRFASCVLPPRADSFLHWHATQCAPILVDGRIVGIAGVDYSSQSPPPEGKRLWLDRHEDRHFLLLDLKGNVICCGESGRELISRHAGGWKSEALPPWLGRRLRSKRPLLDQGAIVPLGTWSLGAGDLAFRLVKHPRRPLLLLICEEGRSPPPEEKRGRLTRREREVLDWLGCAKTSSEISAVLGISPHTVKRHLESIYHKLGVRNRLGATRFSRPLPD